MEIPKLSRHVIWYYIIWHFLKYCVNTMVNEYDYGNGMYQSNLVLRSGAITVPWKSFFCNCLVLFWGLYLFLFVSLQMKSRQNIYKYKI